MARVGRQRAAQQAISAGVNHELELKEKVTKILAQNNICVRVAKYSIFSDEPAAVSLVFRNPTQDELRFPGLESQDGRLYISPEVILTLHQGFGKNRKVIDRLPDRVFVSDGVAPIVVGKFQERRITLDLKRIFDFFAEDSYVVSYKIKGTMSGNDCEFF